jgi:tetratricopeptide (TPR) repeat protein
MRKTHNKLLFLLLAACLDGQMAYAATAQEQRLLDQANYWQQRGRADMAASAWRKLLTSDPNNADALAGLAVAEAQAGNADAARGYLDRLKKSNPGYPGMARTERLVSLGKQDDTALAEARQLARSGQSDAAIAKYRESTGGAAPEGQLGMEYYQTLGGTPQGWEEARAGMEKLVASDPANRRYQLALGQHLTYRESTRRRGIDMLSHLSSSPDVAAEAGAAWRQGLLWLNAKRGDAPLYSHYLGYHADDAEVRQKLAMLNRAGKVAGNGGPSVNPRTQMALKAEKVRQRGHAEQERGDLAAAQASYEEAVFLDPDTPWARLDLARLYAKQGRVDDGRSMMNGLVASNPNRPDVLYASALYSSEQKQWREGLDTLEKVPAKQRDREMVELQRRMWLNAQYERARSLHQRGDTAQAQRVLHKIEGETAGDTDNALALADAYADTGNSEQAMTVLRNALNRDPHPSVEMRRRYAWMLLKTGQDAELALQLRQLSQEKLTPADRADINEIRLALGIKQADNARKAGKYAVAYDHLAPLSATHKDDPRLLMAMARLYASAGEEKTALKLYASAIEHDPANMDAREGYIATATNLKEYDKAQAMLDESQRMEPKNVHLKMRAGQLAKARGDYDLAIRNFREAEALQREANGGKDTGPRLKVADQEEAPVLTASGLPVTPFAQRSEPVAKPVRSAALSAAPAKADGPTPESEIADIQSHNSTSFAGGMAVRLRSGEAGLSQLTDIELPMEFSTTAGYTGRMSLKLTPVMLNAGDLPQANTTVASRFGTMAMAVPMAGAANLAQRDTGMAIGIGYSNDDVVMDIGTTPLGFAVRNVVGGVRIEPQMGNLKLTMELSRRSVTDSLLSYAGTVDPTSGLTWGGVISTGGAAKLTYESGEFGAYINGGVHALNGTNVASNSVVEMGGGTYWKVIDTDEQLMSVGLNLTTLFYQKNLRYYTMGHGGYFSPQSFYAFSVPMDLTGRDERLTYKIGGALGIQHFTEQSAAYYPNDPAMQANLQARIVGNPALGLVGTYPGQTSTGIAYRFYGILENQLQPQMYLGGQFSLDNASNYTQGAGLIYLRYMFEAQKRPEKPEVHPVAPNYTVGMGGL